MELQNWDKLTYLYFKNNILIMYGYLPSKNNRSHIEHKIDFPDIFALCDESSRKLGQ